MKMQESKLNGGAHTDTDCAFFFMATGFANAPYFNT
jgi:hypothetical protein